METKTDAQDATVAGKFSAVSEERIFIHNVDSCQGFVDIFLCAPAKMERKDIEYEMNAGAPQDPTWVHKRWAVIEDRLQGIPCDMEGGKATRRHWSLRMGGADGRRPVGTGKAGGGLAS